MKRHHLDAFSLVAGTFVTIVAVAALTGPWQLAVGAWAGPALLIGGGVVILALVVTGSRGAATGAAAEEVDEHHAEAMVEAYAELDDDMILDES